MAKIVATKEKSILLLLREIKQCSDNLDSLSEEYKKTLSDISDELSEEETKQIHSKVEEASICVEKAIESVITKEELVELDQLVEEIF